MNTSGVLTFEAPQLGEQLTVLASDAFDALPFGVVEMDLHGNVLRYNATESQAAGLTPDRVVGRHFFRDVAPCANTRQVAHRFDESSLDETLAYTFSLRMKLRPVRLRMLKPVDGERMYLIISLPE